MPNYQNGKIYKICSHHTDDVYYGSTTQSLAVRLGGHKSQMKNWKAGKGCNYVTSFEVLKYEDSHIVFVADAKCDTKEQLLAKESEYIKKNKCVNKYVPNRTRKEYYQDNKDEISEKGKQFYIQNTDAVLKNRKEYYDSNKEKVKERVQKYTVENKEKIQERLKEYRKNNSDRINEKDRVRYQLGKEHAIERQKQYYQNNKERIRNKRKEKMICECGSEIVKTVKKRHDQSQKHQAYLLSLNPIEIGD